MAVKSGFVSLASNMGRENLLKLLKQVQIIVFKILFCADYQFSQLNAMVFVIIPKIR